MAAGSVSLMLARRGIVGTERERFVAVMARMKEMVSGLIATLDRLSAEYVEHLKCGAPFCARRCKILSKQIAGLDCQIFLCQNPDLFYFLVQAYYHQRLDSVGCAQELNLSPWGVRQHASGAKELKKQFGRLQADSSG